MMNIVRKMYLHDIETNIDIPDGAEWLRHQARRDGAITRINDFTGEIWLGGDMGEIDGGITWLFKLSRCR